MSSSEDETKAKEEQAKKEKAKAKANLKDPKHSNAEEAKDEAKGQQDGGGGKVAMRPVSGGSQAWAEFNKKNKADAGKFFADPTISPRLLIAGVASQPSITLLHKVERIAGDAWEHKVCSASLDGAGFQTRMSQVCVVLS